MMVDASDEMRPDARLAPPYVGLVNCATRSDLIADITRRFQSGEGFTLATLNLDHIIKLRRNAVFADAYARHSHVVADGNPIVWLRNFMNEPVDLLPGSDLVKPLAELAEKQSVPIALLGATPEALENAAKSLERAFPNLKVVAKVAPPFGLDPTGPQADEAIAEVAVSGARLCFLALGAPKQEILAVRALTRVPVCGFVSIGAGLDFIAGTQKRAPRWVRKIAMEWLWRLLSSPRRLFKRYAECFVVLPGLFIAAYRLRGK